MSRAIAIALVVVPIGWPASARAQACADPDAAWLFCDDFESSADETGALGLWDDQGLSPENLVLTTDAARVHSGDRALQITAHRAVDTGGGPTKWFDGQDLVHARFYVQFDEDYHYAHHFVTLVANRADDPWAGFGMAGCRPGGDNFFSSGIEPWFDWGANAPPGEWNFYSYSVDMSCDTSCDSYADPVAICANCADRGSPCNSGPECCWGNSYAPDVPVISSLGSWVCVEMMVQANTGGEANGEQSFSIDGEEVGRWGGIRWRTDDALQIDALALWHYVTDDNYRDGQTEQTVWFDDVVVSTEAIGCEEPPPDDPDAGPDAGVDAGDDADAGRDGGADGEDAKSDGGCGCRAASAGRTSYGIYFASLFVTAVALLARRRVSSRTS